MTGGDYGRRKALDYEPLMLFLTYAHMVPGVTYAEASRAAFEEAFESIGTEPVLAMATIYDGAEK